MITRRIEKYPEKGVRVMSMAEAYPEDFDVKKKYKSSPGKSKKVARNPQRKQKRKKRERPTPSCSPRTAVGAMDYERRSKPSLKSSLETLKTEPWVKTANLGMDIVEGQSYLPSADSLVSSKDAPKIRSLLEKIFSLRLVNSELRCDLKNSERLRKEMKMKLKVSGIHGGKDDLLAKVMNMNWNRSLRIKGDQHVGILIDLSHEKEALHELDLNLANLNHVPRIDGEHPVAIISERELETVSYPIDDTIKSHLVKIDEAICCRNSMVGHIEIAQEEIEITSGFIGAKGNLVWVNTEDSVIRLSLKAGKDCECVLLDPGFGFCVGKRERHTRMFLSSIYRAMDVFDDTGKAAHQAHATFFGCDDGDENCWLEGLNAETWATEYMNGGFKQQNRKGIMDTSERNLRLGIKFRNVRRHQIRIAPMKESGIQPGLLSEKVSEVERWVRDTLGQARSAGLPKKFTVIPEKEKPQIGDPFDVLWVKFKIDDDTWDDELMWDIRFLLMGSKLDKLPGFPLELNQIRDKLYISRDGISERLRRAGRV